MPDLRRVHRFRDHAVAGVNWRPTRFVDEVPSLRICDLCRIIPMRILVLPCGHVLCASCHAASSQGCSGRCPLDQEPFEEGECSGYDLATRKANTLKVYCWNETHGCEYEGTTEDMLRHYETECTFHSVECLRCGEGVLHKELAAHYVAGCSTGGSSPRTDNAPSESRALTLMDVTAALEEVKSLLDDSNNGRLLPAIQSQVNELTEQVREQGSTLAEITREVGESVRSQVAQVAANMSSATSQPECTSGRDPIAPVGKSASENPLIPRELDHLADLPRHVLLGMRKTSSQDYPQHFIDLYDPWKVKCHLSLITPLPPARSWGQVLGNVKYNMAFKDIDREMLLQANTTTIAKVTVLHMRDAYFTVEVRTNVVDLLLEVKFYGFPEGSFFAAHSFDVKACRWAKSSMESMYCWEYVCVCKKQDKDAPLHRHRIFNISIYSLLHDGYFRDGMMEFEIEISRK